jgi:hypothetical protein
LLVSLCSGRSSPCDRFYDDLLQVVDELLALRLSRLAGPSGAFELFDGGGLGDEPGGADCSGDQEEHRPSDP